MSRTIDESNVAQGVREIVQSITLLPIGLSVVIAHQMSSRTSSDYVVTLFFVWTAIFMALIVRELAWLVKMYRWYRRRYTEARPPSNAMVASAIDYKIWIAVHIILALVAIVPLLILWYSNGWRGNYDSQHIRQKLIDSFFFGLLVAVVTGNALSGGIIAGVERWSDLNNSSFATEHGNKLLITLLVIAIALSYFNAFRTIFALYGYDPHYLTMLKAVRWSWDAHSELFALKGPPNSILASTSRQPFLQIRGDKKHLSLGLRHPDDVYLVAAQSQTAV